MKNVKFLLVMCVFFISFVTVNVSDVAAASQADTKVVAKKINQNKYVKAEGGLIVRKEAHSKGAKVTMLKDGSKVFVYSTDSNGWSYIKQGNIKGYVKDSYLNNHNPSTKNNNASKKRVVDLSMNINQVKKMEPAKLSREITKNNMTLLQYVVEKYEYVVVLEYYFVDGKLKYIHYDFLPEKDSYNSWDEMQTMFDILDKKALQEFGYGTFVYDKYNFLFRHWEKEGYNILLNVSNENLYTEAQLIFYKK